MHPIDINITHISVELDLIYVKYMQIYVNRGQKSGHLLADMELELHCI